MFSKKCFKCGGAVKNDFDFCPFCGNSVKSIHDKEDYGFLGRHDFDSVQRSLNEPFIEKLFTNTMRLFEQQMKHFQRELIRDTQSMPKHNNNLHIQFFVNGRRVFPEYTKEKKSPIVNYQQNYPQLQERFLRYAHLPRKEPAVQLRRLSGKLVYELHVPGVKSVEDILINRLENSTEIKALTDESVYLKNLNLTLPILRYALKNDVLILEFRDF